MHEIAHTLIRLVAPILVHTADEAWLALRGEDEASERCVHLEPLPDVATFAADPGWEQAFALRAEVLRKLERAKEELGISNPLDAGATVLVPADRLRLLEPFLPEMADLCGMSRFALAEGETESIEIVDLREEPRCERSWKRDHTVRMRSDGGMLSERDAAVVGVS
jgi:isoleucyl-tRNA synthetase